MEVQQLFENNIEPFENYLSEVDSASIVFIHYPDCQFCYLDYLDNNQELKYQTSKLIFTSSITHGQAYKGFKDYLSWFDKVFFLKKGNKSIQNLIDKQTLVSLQVNPNGEIAVLQKTPSPNSY